MCSDQLESKLPFCVRGGRSDSRRARRAGGEANTHTWKQSAAAYNTVPEKMIDGV